MDAIYDEVENQKKISYTQVILNTFKKYVETVNPS